MDYRKFHRRSDLICLRICFIQNNRFIAELEKDELKLKKALYF